MFWRISCKCCALFNMIISTLYNIDKRASYFTSSTLASMVDFFLKHIFARNRRVKNYVYQGRKLWVVQKLWNIIKLYSEEILGGVFCVVKYKVVHVLWMVVWETCCKNGFFVCLLVCIHFYTYMYLEKFFGIMGS